MRATAWHRWQGDLPSQRFLVRRQPSHAQACRRVPLFLLMDFLGPLLVPRDLSSLLPFSSLDLMPSDARAAAGRGREDDADEPNHPLIHCTVGNGPSLFCFLLSRYIIVLGMSSSIDAINFLRCETVQRKIHCVVS